MGKMLWLMLSPTLDVAPVRESDKVSGKTSNICLLLHYFLDMGAAFNVKWEKVE